VQRIPIAIGSAGIAAVATCVLALLVDDASIASSSIVLISFGLMVVAATGLAGLLLARAPWGRWTMVFAVIMAMGLGSLSSSPLIGVGYATGAVALVGLFGPWLRLWIRHHRVADGPGVVPVLLMSAGPAAPLLIGLCSAQIGADGIQWATALVALAGSALYGRGARLGLWTYRLVMAPVGAVCAVATGGIGGAVIGGATMAVVVASWLPAARRTTTVIAPVLPAPVRRP